MRPLMLKTYCFFPPCIVACKVPAPAGFSGVKFLPVPDILVPFNSSETRYPKAVLVADFVIEKRFTSR